MTSKQSLHFHLNANLQPYLVIWVVFLLVLFWYENSNNKKRVEAEWMNDLARGVKQVLIGSLTD